MKYKKKDNVSVEALHVKGCEITISKPDGQFSIAKDGDWIVKGPTGELYPVENKIFQKTYEVENA